MKRFQIGDKVIVTFRKTESAVIISTDQLQPPGHCYWVRIGSIASLTHRKFLQPLPDVNQLLKELL